MFAWAANVWKHGVLKWGSCLHRTHGKLYGKQVARKGFMMRSSISYGGFRN